jgi:hypothetical protein
MVLVVVVVLVFSYGSGYGSGFGFGFSSGYGSGFGSGSLLSFFLFPCDSPNNSDEPTRSQFFDSFRR